MAKKDFSSIDIMHSEISAATAETEEKKPRKERKTYTTQEAAEIMQTLRTSGRKGVKLPRINLAFTPENYTYIQIMSKAAGYNLTEFVNMALLQYRTEHAEEYKQVLDLRERLKQ